MVDNMLSALDNFYLITNLFYIQKKQDCQGFPITPDKAQAENKLLRL